MQTIGSISHGTLRPEDLLSTFAHVLQECIDADADHPEGYPKLIKEAQAIFVDTADPDPDEVSELINDLSDALNEYAPPFCYFGTHPGDGSDFGFWPSMDQIEELPKIADPADLDSMNGAECAFVNDHGNVTVYSGGKVVLELV